MEYQLNSSLNTTKLKEIIEKCYNFTVVDLKLHREMIGFIYFAQTSLKRIVIKLFRSFHEKQAISSLKLNHFLRKHNFKVPSIILARDNSLFLKIKYEKEYFILAIFEFIDGETPQISQNVKYIGKYVKNLHDLMKLYPYTIINHGKEYYIDRFVHLLHSLEYDPSRISKLENFGTLIWKKMGNLSKGICHGDLHSGNMIQTSKGNIYLLDFDTTSWSFPIIDIATICDQSDFNHLQESAFDETHYFIETFMKGYNKRLNNDEFQGVFYFIGARHYELIATIAEARGNERISREFLDQQYFWLMEWQKICENRL